VIATGRQLISAALLAAMGLVLGATHARSGEAVSAVAEAGKGYYQEYCASCHGVDGRGDGPMATQLQSAPPDLTRIAKDRGGVLPMDELAASIDGRRSVAAHGSREMPAWGQTFAADYAGDAQQREIVRGKILMLLVYLESIQR
jgi:mono/diheme cytochrome c family protein